MKHLRPKPGTATIAAATKTPNAKTLTLPSKMPRKSILKPALVTLFLLLAIYAFFITFSYPNPSIPFVSRESLTNSPGNSAPVKVYMYDLPRKFTYGVIESYAMARGAIKGPIADVSELTYPGNQHSAEWYLFADLNRVGRVDSAVTRVMDPEEADLFYVPFFSSLSLVANPIRPGTTVGGDGPVYSDEEMQIDVLEVDGVYYGFSGCHRFEAHQRLGLPTIRCKIRRGTKGTLRHHLRLVVGSYFYGVEPSRQLAILKKS